jgi:hypothetical protein
MEKICEITKISQQELPTVPGIRIRYFFAGSGIFITKSGSGSSFGSRNPTLIIYTSLLNPFSTIPEKENYSFLGYI